ncbi:MULTISPECIES: hypothetical protein [unclassified Luteimonas]|uniref:hypothetical protein n=1 Tax=Lysobacteraceae TaxID=32033 RepID=UPI00100BDF73|nr:MULTISPECIES: hypothetical protein [unclassified Luteimonas]MCD9048054.1 hypothetical protein [Luteimonas sp. MHLX1A]
MSSIGSDPHLGLAGLDRLAGQVAFDDLRQQPGHAAPLDHVAGLEPATAPGPQVDDGERMLAAPAWAGIDQGARMLAGDGAFEHALSASPLSEAADQATGAILAALG